jgi:hypothetical protein
MSVRSTSVRTMLLACLGVMTAAPLMAQQKAATDSTISMDSLRVLLRAGKKAIVDSNMTLTAAEATKFWPVYDAYQADIAKLNTRTGALIQSYADAYNKGGVTDAVASKLTTDYIAIEADRVALMQSYLPKFNAVIPPTKVARYYQIENKLRAIGNFALADQIPLVQ